MRRKISWTVLSALLMAIVVAPCATDEYDPQKKISAEALREDLQTLWNILDEGHAGLDRYTPRDRLKAVLTER